MTEGHDGTKASEYLIKPLVTEDGPLSREQRGPADEGGKQPRLHRIERDVYGIESFPVQVLILAYQEIFEQFDRWSWDPNLKDSDLFITDKYPEDLDEDELKPTIVVSRGPVTPMQINGRGHNMHYDVRTGMRDFRQLMRVQMTIQCLSQNGIEASQIASAVFGISLQLELDLKRRGVHAIIGNALGEEGVVVEAAATELVMVPVMFEMQFAWAWAMGPDKPFFDKASIEIDEL
jgi:hypothetical protein